MSHLQVVNEIAELLQGESLRIAVASPTGNGKSATLQNIVDFCCPGAGIQFTEGMSADSVTSEAKKFSFQIGNLTIELTDNPGLFDTRGIETDINALRELAERHTKDGETFHIIFLVQRINSRFIPMEKASIDIFTRIYGDDCKQHLLQVLTYGESVNTPEDLSTLEGQFKTKMAEVLEMQIPSVTITNHPRNTMPNGVDRKKSVIDILTKVRDMIRVNPNSFVPRQLDTEEIRRVVEEGKKKWYQQLTEADWGEILGAIVTVLTIFSSGGCNLL